MVDVDPWAELAEVRRAYAARLPDKLAELRAALEAARAGEEPLVEARHVAHRLAGSAGSYGHPAVSAAVAEIEHALIAAIAEPAEREALLAAAIERAATIGPR